MGLKGWVYFIYNIQFFHQGHINVSLILPSYPLPLFSQQIFIAFLREFVTRANDFIYNPYEPPQYDYEISFISQHHFKRGFLESKMMVTRLWELEELGKCWSKSIKFQLDKMNKFGEFNAQHCAYM